MIDWITARVPIRSAVGLNTGVVISVNAHGEEEWSSPKRTNVRGSHAATVAVKKFKNGEVEFAGSPAKFLQGHNVFDSDDLLGLGAAMIERACGALGLELLDSELPDIRAGRYDLKRVDINYSFATGSRENALAWIEKAAAVGTLQNRGTGRLRKSSTVTWGESSRHWKLKAYSKGQEIAARDHGLPDTLPMLTGLAAWSDDKLRLELELHARELQKLGLDTAASWRADVPQKLFRDYVAKLRLGEHLVLNPSAVRSLPSHLRQTYSNWVLGADLRQLMSKQTYCRQRKQLMALGINIAAPHQLQTTDVMPLSRYLETPCAKVSEWAVGTPLYYGVGRSGIKVGRAYGVTSTGPMPGAATPPPPIDSTGKDVRDAQAQCAKHKPLEVAA